MKKLIPLLVSSILVVGTFGCQEAPKTGSETPNTTNEAAQAPASPASQVNQTTTNVPVKETAEKTAATKAKGDLKTEVSKNLNKGLPGNKLQVENKEGEIILKGTAASKEELQKAETLAKEVQGVKTVKVEAKVEATKKP